MISYATCHEKNTRGFPSFDRFPFFSSSSKPRLFSQPMVPHDSVLYLQVARDQGSSSQEETIIEIPVHRIILSGCSGYFEAHFRCKTNSVILLEHLTSSDRPLIEEFFRLFYRPVFDDLYFTVDERLFLLNNVLPLHWLASRFEFMPLLRYCRTKIYASFTPTDFNRFQAFCLAEKADGHYTVVEESRVIFERLIGWLVCCAWLPSSPPPPAHHPRPAVESPAPTRKRRRLSTENERVIALYDQLELVVEDFKQYDCYSRHLSDVRNTRGQIESTTIRSFSRICGHCVSRKRELPVCRMSQEVSQEYVSHWFFYLSLSLEAPSHLFTFCLTTARSPDREHLAHTCQASGGETYLAGMCDGPRQVTTSVSFLSKEYKNKAHSQMPILTSLTQPTQIAEFSLPGDMSQCYEGHCDVCQQEGISIHVIKYNLFINPL